MQPAASNAGAASIDLLRHEMLLLKGAWAMYAEKAFYARCKTNPLRRGLKNGAARLARLNLNFHRAQSSR